MQTEYLRLNSRSPKLFLTVAILPGFWERTGKPQNVLILPGLGLTVADWESNSYLLGETKIESTT